MDNSESNASMVCVVLDEICGPNPHYEMQVLPMA